MSKINDAAFALLLAAAIPAAAQSPAMAPDASARKSVQPAAAASDLTIDQKGVKRTVPYVPAGSPTADQNTMQRGNGSNAKPHTNSGDSNPESAAALRGKPTKDQISSGDNSEGAAALRVGKPTKDQVTANSPGSGNARTTSPIVNSTTARTPGAVTTPGAPTPGVDASGNKSFFESRSNTARSPEAAAATTGTAAADDAAAQRQKKINTSKSNLRTGSTAIETASKPTPPDAAPGSTSSIFKN
jgi:hypothetical protein